MNISKQDVGFDIEQLELASHIVLSEASGQHHIGDVEDGKELSSSSDSEISSDDDDDDDDDGDSDSSSSSSESSVADNCTKLTDHDKVVSVSRVSGSGDGNSRPALNVSDSLVVNENILPAAADAAATEDPADLVCKQLSSLIVSDKQQITAVASEPSQSDTDLSVER